MSRTTLLLVVVVLAAAVLVAAKPQPGKLDSVDVDQVIKNKRLFDNYVKCILDKGRCSAEGEELKARLPNDLETKCSGCTASEKTRAKKIINHVKTQRKDVWEDFKKKYDPTGKMGDFEWVSEV